MSNGFVLMTALPPTTGHADLIDFASGFMVDDGVLTVIVSTQPSEPRSYERFWAIHNRYRFRTSIKVRWMNEEIEQNPEAEGFWDMWRGFMDDYGFEPGDLIFASEPYGARLAEECGGRFIPYDCERSMNPVKATAVRKGDVFEWGSLMPEFRMCVTPRITFFGAESVGKTTQSADVAHTLGGQWLAEYARPYLETVGNVLTREKMTDIWHGQAAIQKMARNYPKKPVVIQDTDLFSTIGHWRFGNQGTPPWELTADALGLKSDLYIILSSEIDFEEDPLRYGGKVRESADQYWIDLCKEFNLNYVVVTGTDMQKRYMQCIKHVNMAIGDKWASLGAYERKNNG